MKGKYRNYGIIFTGVLVTILLLMTACTSSSTTGTETSTTAIITTGSATTSAATTTTSATLTSSTTATTATSTTSSATSSTTGTATTSATTTASATATTSATATATAPAVGGTVEVLGVWGSSELDSFNAMIAPWKQQNNANVNFTGTRDLTAILTTRIQAGNPPDIAILPNPGLMKQYANAGKLKALDTMLDMNTIKQQYPQSWVDLGTVNGKYYALFIKAANKSMVWYNPSVFNTNGWKTPSTWDEMITLSNQIVSAGKTPGYPWAMGVENGAASGWAGTDWIAQIFLEQNGGDAYDQWITHQIPWTDPRVKAAWQAWGTIVNTQGYVPGGSTTVAATNFQDASYWPFQSPPKAAMYYEGDFIQGFITTQFPNLKSGTDFDYFPFPTVNTQYQDAVTGGADLIVVFNDTPTVRSFVNYMATPQAQSIWVKRGGFVSVNKQVAITDYPDQISQKSVQQLLSAKTFRFGAGDSMPGAMQTAWWSAILQYLQNPSQLDSLLSSLENTAKTAYSASATPSASATK
jgi:alpha-glucoside transport system substrate-binding protein